MKNLAFATMSLALGAWSFLEMQRPLIPFANSVSAGCEMADIDAAVAEHDIRAYEPQWGFGMLGEPFRPFGCMLTQWFYELTQNDPAGLLTFATALAVIQPTLVVWVVEAGRGGAKGPITYLVSLLLVSQAVGISVVFTAIWLPAYLVYFVASRQQQAVSSTRALAAIPLAIPFFVCTICCFWLHPNSKEWQISAALETGPIPPLVYGVLWLVGPPKNASEKAQLSKGAQSTVAAHILTGALAFMLWWFVIYATFTTYGVDASGLALLWKDVWSEANACVFFMTMDALALWLGLLLFISFHNWFSLLEAVISAVVFGPGASCSLALARIELQRLSSYTETTNVSNKNKSD